MKHHRCCRNVERPPPVHPATPTPAAAPSPATGGDGGGAPRRQRDEENKRQGTGRRSGARLLHVMTWPCSVGPTLIRARPLVVSISSLFFFCPRLSQISLSFFFPIVANLPIPPPLARRSRQVGSRGPAAMDHAELTTEQVLKRDIPWESYMANKLISGTCLQHLRRYDHKPESQQGPLLDEDGPSYVLVFLNILRNISKEETVEYVLALIDEMLAANPKRATLFYDISLSGEDIYDPFLRLLLKGNWFVQEKSCKILTHIISARPKVQNGVVPNGEASNSKSKLTSTQDVLRGLVDWLCYQLRNPTHPNCSVPTAMHCLATLLREPYVRTLFVQADGVKLLIPLICPASTQQSTQLLYETCLCIWLLSFYDAAVDYLSTTRVMPRLVEVVKGSTKEKVVRVVIMSIGNLLAKGAFAAQVIDLGLLHIVQNLKAQAWTDEDLLDALTQLEVGLKDNLKKLSSFDKYKQQVLLGHLDWSPMHKDPGFWRENINNFEENDFQILRVLMTIIDTSTDTTALAVACYDLSQFLQYHPSGRIVVANLKAKDRVMKLMDHENAEVRKNSLLCVQRLFLGAKYASFLQT